AAVAVRDVVQHQQRGAARLVGGLGVAAGLLLRVLRADPLGDRLLGDLPYLLRLALLAVLDQLGDLAGGETVRIDPERGGFLRLLRDLRAGRGLTIASVDFRPRTPRHQLCRPQHHCGRPPPGARPDPPVAVPPTPLGWTRIKSMSLNPDIRLVTPTRLRPCLSTSRYGPPGNPAKGRSEACGV